MPKQERFFWMLALLVTISLAIGFSPTLAQRINDYAFVRTLVDINRQVSANYVEPVDREKLENAAIDGLLSQLDPFSVYVPPSRQEDFDRMLEGTFKGVGVQLNQLDNGRIEVVSPIDGSPAFRAGVMAGDVILKVNGQSVDGQRLPDVIKRIGGDANTQVTLTVRHLSGEEVDLSMKREEIVVPTIKGYQRKADNSWDYWVLRNPKIAYVRLTQFTPTTYDTLRPILTGLVAEGMKGLVLDLRFNPGGQLDQAVSVVDMFLNEGVIVITRGRNRPEDIKRATVPGTLPDFPMVVLVNEHSASAAEIVAGSLQDNHRAVVIGARSYGKGSVQELVPLDGNSGELKLTVAYYYLPSGRLVHRKKEAKDWGVEPTIKVAMDEKAQREVLRDRYEQDLFHRPTTGPATAPAATQPIVDEQLQRALDTMVALSVLGGKPVTIAPNLAGPTTTASPVPLEVDPTSAPAQTQPSSEPPATVPADLPAPATQP